ncbi:MAG: HAD family hydrolase [Candidatus Dadabacteria bacterium]
MSIPGHSYKAFLFDLNGTMINDMHFHIRSWHRILTDIGAQLSFEEVKHQCYGKNHEMLERVFPGRFTDEEKDEMSYAKELQYQQEFRPHLKLIKGLESFIRNAHSQGIKLGIGSAAILFNIDFVIDGLNIRDYIDVIVSADDVDISKPHPETFTKCAGYLGIEPSDCLVFEDTPKGAEAAANAGMDCVIIKTLHPQDEFRHNSNIIGFIDDYEDAFISNLLQWKQNF